MPNARREPGGGTVRRLPSGRWQARFRGSDGRLLPAPVTFESRFDAEWWLHLLSETPDAEQATRRYELGVRRCDHCNLDFRPPTRRSHRLCDACKGRRRDHLMQARAQGTHTKAEWTTLLAEHDGLCAYCKTAPGLTKDHVIPVSKGGSDAIGNIVPACRPCNSSKGARVAPSAVAS